MLLGEQITSVAKRFTVARECGHIRGKSRLEPGCERRFAFRDRRLGEDAGNQTLRTCGDVVKT